MAKIYIGLSCPVKWKLGAQAIMWWMGKPYSHAYIRFESSNSKVPSNVYQASHGMVHFRTYENFLKDNKSVKEQCYEITDEKRLSILILCMTLAGEKYDTLDLVKVFATELLEKIAIKIKTSDGDGYICSELVGQIMEQELGFKFSDEIHLLTPSRIDMAIEKQLSDERVAQLPKQPSS